MKNIKITLSNGKELVKLETTTSKARAFAKNPKFNNNDLKFKLTEASDHEVFLDKQRLLDINNNYNEVCEYNAKVSRYNSALSKATNHNEFMNAAHFLK